MSMELRRARPHAPPPTPQPTPEAEIDPRLYESLPDVDPAGPPLAAAPAELQALLATVQAEMQAVLQQEVMRVGAHVAWLFEELEARLAQSERLLDEAREENARLAHAQDRYERAFLVLKDLTRDIESAD